MSIIEKVASPSTTPIAKATRGDICGEAGDFSDGAEDEREVELPPGRFSVGMLLSRWLIGYDLLPCLCEGGGPLRNKYWYGPFG
jgi:hypothetical protein